MRIPDVYLADDLCKDPNSMGQIGGKWFLSRPIGYHAFGLQKRLRCAWHVFTGKSDVLIWAQDQSEETDSVVDIFDPIDTQDKAIAALRTLNTVAFGKSLISRNAFSHYMNAIRVIENATGEV